ncbi:MAG: hypothetical protein JXA58_07765 [Dehalococcoidia bacterium]|nr:hypothetical protein [Dehalococcoidia bacterium]
MRATELTQGRVRWFVALTICALAVGCVGAKEPLARMPDGYTLVYNIPASVVASVWINGEPVAEIVGQLSGSRDVTNLIASGTNKIDVRLRRTDGGSGDGLQVNIVRCSFADRTEDTETVMAIGDPEWNEQLACKVASEFVGDMPLKWIWEGADRIGELTDKDRQAIESALRDLAKSVDAKDFKEFRRLRKRWCLGGETPKTPEATTALARWAQREEQALSQARSVAVMPQAERVLLVGEHLVLMSRKAVGTEGHHDEKLFGFTTDGKDGSGEAGGLEYGEQFLYFCRLDGAWHILAYNWRT